MDPLAALGSPRRRELLRLLWNQEQNVAAIHTGMPDVTLGAISLQLKALSEAGLVTVRVDGRQRFYRARREALGEMAALLERMWDDALARLKLAAELEASRRGPRQKRKKTASSAAKASKGSKPR